MKVNNTFNFANALNNTKKSGRNNGDFKEIIIKETVRNDVIC